MDSRSGPGGSVLSAAARRARSQCQVDLLEERNMRSIVKFLIALGIAAALSGCVVAPVGPPRAYVAAAVVTPAPVVVVRGGYYWRH
jgi:hypothetical protein